MKGTYLRGDMYCADLGKGIGSEQEGYRPVVIVQNDIGNRYSTTVIVAALSSKVRAKARLPTHYCLDAVCGLQTPSVVLLEQLRTVDKRRFGRYIGRLDKEHMEGLNHALAVSIGLTAPTPNMLTLCLCDACADNFRSTGAFAVCSTDAQRHERDICACCKQRPGSAYVLSFKREMQSQTPSEGSTL